jgi:hypothetical protein
MEPSKPIRQEAVEAALASAAARRIISKCIRQPQPIKTPSMDAGTPLASTYRLVKEMVDAGILVIERSAMTPDGKPFDLYRSRIRTARIEIRADHVETTWEANAALEDRIAHLWNQIGR